MINHHITFWKETTRIKEWYRENQDKMSEDYLPAITEMGNKIFDYYEEKSNKAQSWQDLNDITFTVTDVIDSLMEKIYSFKKAPEQFIYIFYLLHLPGTIYHREYILIELNKIIKKISTELNEDETIESIDALFYSLESLKELHEHDSGLYPNPWERDPEY